MVEDEGTTPEGPDFHMVAYQGQEVLGADELDVTQLFGRGKPVVLNFWAGLCPPCRAEMPGFQRVYDDLGDQFLLVGVDIGPFTGLGSNADARALLEELNISYPTAYATEDPTRSFAVLGMPTTVLFTADGRTVAKRTGFLPEDALRSSVKDLLAPPSLRSLDGHFSRPLSLRPRQSPGAPGLRHPRFADRDRPRGRQHLWSNSLPREREAASHPRTAAS